MSVDSLNLRSFYSNCGNVRSVGETAGRMNEMVVIFWSCNENDGN